MYTAGALLAGAWCGSTAGFMLEVNAPGKVGPDIERQDTRAAIASGRDEDEHRERRTTDIADEREDTRGDEARGTLPASSRRLRHLKFKTTRGEAANRPGRPIDLSKTI